MPVSEQQLHELLMYCINFAQTMLKDSGEFYPFGANVTADGKLGAVGAHDGEEHPEPQALYQTLAGAFTAGARNGELLAVALAANVNVPPQFSAPFPDAVRVHLETSGYSRLVYIPYRLSRKGLLRKSTVAELSEPFSVEIRPSFFAAPSA